MQKKKKKKKKQSSRGVFRKRCSENVQQTYMNFQQNYPCWRSAISIVNLLNSFRTPFPKNTSEGLILKNSIYIQWTKTYAKYKVYDHSNEDDDIEDNHHIVLTVLDLHYQKTTSRSSLIVRRRSLGHAKPLLMYVWRVRFICSPASSNLLKDFKFFKIMSGHFSRFFDVFREYKNGTLA